MSKYPKMIVEDFPIIPILGSLLLMLAYVNNVPLTSYLLSPDGKLMAPVIATSVIMLGAGGIMASRLISFALFANLFGIHNRILDKGSTPFSDTSKAWFKNLTVDMTPIERESSRTGKHRVESRRSVFDLSDEQIHGTVHALEVSCRDTHPAIATQIDYFYSLYVIFSILGLSALSFSVLFVVDGILGWLEMSTLQGASPTALMFGVDLALGVALMLAAIRARRFKEQLRMKLLNSCRKDAIKLVSEWFHVKLVPDNPPMLAPK